MNQRIVKAVRPDLEVMTRQQLPYFIGISGATVGARGLSMHIVVIPPGGRAQPHAHLGYETGIYVLEGRVRTRWGAQLENDLGVPGSFTNRPHHIFGIVSELLPSELIYPASFAGWLFLALYHAGPVARNVATIAVFVVGTATSMITVAVMEKTRPRRRAELERRGILAQMERERAGTTSRVRPAREASAGRVAYRSSD